jgi:hypothetical protein
MRKSRVFLFINVFFPISPFFFEKKGAHPTAVGSSSTLSVPDEGFTPKENDF